MPLLPEKPARLVRATFIFCAKFSLSNDLVFLKSAHYYLVVTASLIEFVNNGLVILLSNYLIAVRF
jgi:hypothetical protein